MANIKLKAPGAAKISTILTQTVPFYICKLYLLAAIADPGS